MWRRALLAAISDIFSMGSLLLILYSFLSFSSPYQHVPTRHPLQNNQLDEIPPENENESLQQQVPSKNSQNIEDEIYDDSSSNPERCSSSCSMSSQVQISSILDVSSHDLSRLVYRYPNEIMKMERHFSALQHWLQKNNK